MRARLMVQAPKLGHYSAPVDVDLSQADIDRVVAWFGEGSIVLLEKPAPVADDDATDESDATDEDAPTKPARIRKPRR
jgi:hypothetical protein